MKRLVRQGKDINKRLIRRSKLGHPPASAADVKSVLRSLLQQSPIEFESRLKEAISTAPGFNENQLEEMISTYNDKQDDESFNSLFTYIEPFVNKAIERRRTRAEQVLRQQGYRVSPAGGQVYIVDDTEDGDRYQTSAQNETCSCMDFQRIGKLGLWCKHLYAIWSQPKGLLDLS
jgi:hypothetical protein